MRVDSLGMEALLELATELQRPDVVGYDDERGYNISVGKERAGEALQSLLRDFLVEGLT